LDRRRARARARRGVRRSFQRELTRVLCRFDAHAVPPSVEANLADALVLLYCDRALAAAVDAHARALNADRITRRALAVARLATFYDEPVVVRPCRS
jgi:hypothetical protein